MLLYFTYADFEETRVKYEKVHTIYQRLLDIEDIDPTLVRKETWRLLLNLLFDFIVLLSIIANLSGNFMIPPITDLTLYKNLRNLQFFSTCVTIDYCIGINRIVYVTVFK